MGEPVEPARAGPDHPSGATLPDPASVGRRVAARALDLVALLVLYALAGWLVQRTFFPGVVLDGPARGREIAFLRVITVVDVVIALLYETVPVAWRGQTPGKSALGVRVVDTTTGGVPPAGSALARGALLLGPSFVPIIGLYLPLVVAAPLFFDPRRRGFHDRVARTSVVAA